MLDLDLKPSDNKLRQFGFVAFVAFGGLAICAWSEILMFGFSLGGARIPIAAFLAVAASLGAVSSLCCPRANRFPYVAVTILTYPIGVVVSYAILLLLFFGVLTPTGLLLRLFGRDPMNRGLSPAAGSYWCEARPARDRTSYFRQS